jgi:hypothetical protein
VTARCLRVSGPADVAPQSHILISAIGKWPLPSSLIDWLSRLIRVTLSRGTGLYLSWIEWRFPKSLVYSFEFPRISSLPNLFQLLTSLRHVRQNHSERCIVVNL